MQKWKLVQCEERRKDGECSTESGSSSGSSGSSGNNSGANVNDSDSDNGIRGRCGRGGEDIGSISSGNFIYELTLETTSQELCNPYIHHIRPFVELDETSEGAL